MGVNRCVTMGVIQLKMLAFNETKISQLLIQVYCFSKFLQYFYC